MRGIQTASHLETHRTPAASPPQPSRLVLASVGLIIGAVLLVDSLDIKTRPQETLPAAFYSLAILIAAYLAGPRTVALASSVAVAAQSVAAWTHASPLWPNGIEILELALIGVLCTILSARIRREAGLKAEAEINLLQFRGVLEAMIEGVIVFGLDGKVIAMNPPALQMYGFDNEREAVGMDVPEVSGRADLRQPDGRIVTSSERPVSRVLRGEVLTDLEMDLRRSDEGRSATVLYNGRLVQNKAGGDQVGVLTIRDVSERKRGQARLLEQERALATMEERGRLARELHDNLGDVLSYVVAEGQAVRALIDMGDVPTAGEYLDRAIAAAKNGITDMREYVSGLKSAAVSGGLFPAVAELLGRLECSQGVCTEMIVAPGLQEEMIGSADRFQLLRIIQEALANVRKHSVANSANVVFKREFDQFCALIEDDGRGFDLNRIPSEPRTFGLEVMRERAEERGGSLEVVSSPGQGTRIIARLPLANREAIDQEQKAQK